MKLSIVLYQSILLISLFTIAKRSHAQFCTGTVGDPAVIITFGANAPLNNPLSQVQQPYEFTKSTCPEEGFYSVTNSTSQCFNHLWGVLPFDHTPLDSKGNFLLVNALPGPTTIYIDTIRGLCSGHTFQVGAWIANIINPMVCSGTGANPNLTFSIYSLTGSLLGTYSSGEISASQPVEWENRNFQFDLPAGSSDVILKVVDTAPFGCGNGFALDDISFSPCGGNLAIAFPGTNAQEIFLCEEKQPNELLTASYPGFTNPVLQWQISDDGQNFSNIPGEVKATFLRPPTAPGVYYYRFSVFENGSSSCKFNSNPVRIVIVRSPYAQGVNYVFGCYGSTVLLGAAGGSFYHWTGPNGFTSDEENTSIPSVTASNAGRYIVKVTTILGCVGFDSSELVIYSGAEASVSFSEYSMCQGQSVQMNATPSVRYLWTPSDGLSNDTIANPVASPSKTTTYTVKVYNESVTCYDTASVKIIVWANPKANAGPDKFVYDEHSVVLMGSAGGSGINYSWSPSTYLSDPLSITPIANPLQTITYKLTVTSNYGCGTSTDLVTVKVIDSLLIPTAFTPNNDGLNDTWVIITFAKYKDATVEVYNRLGQRVYSGSGSNYKPWEGTFEGEPVLAGTYVYSIRLKKHSEIIKGILNVIR